MCKNVTFNLYINCSNNLSNLSPLGHHLVKAAALLGVREVLKFEDLKLPILLDEGDDGDATVFKYGASRESAETRPLCHVYGLWCEMTYV